MTPPAAHPEQAFARLEAAVAALRARVLERRRDAAARIERFGTGPGALIVALSVEHASALDDHALEVGVTARVLPGGGLRAGADLLRRSGEPLRELAPRDAQGEAVAALLAEVEAWLGRLSDDVLALLAAADGPEADAAEAADDPL